MAPNRTLQKCSPAPERFTLTENVNLWPKPRTASHYGLTEPWNLIQGIFKVIKKHGQFHLELLCLFVPRFEGWAVRGKGLGTVYGSGLQFSTGEASA